LGKHIRGRLAGGQGILSDEDLKKKQPEDRFLSVLEYFKKNNTGRDEDVRFLINAAMESGYVDLVCGVIKRDLKLGVQATTLNKVFGAGFVPKFEVMLAESYKDNADYVNGKEFIITEKLDGVRCVLILNQAEDGQVAANFFSRSGQPITDLVELAAEAVLLPPEFVYDGELLLANPNNLTSDDLYRATVCVTNADGEKRNLFFNIFDMIEKTAFQSGIDRTPAIERKRRLEKVLTDKSGGQENVLQTRGQKNVLSAQTRGQENVLQTRGHLVPVEMLYYGTDCTQINAKMAELCNTKSSEGIMLNLAMAPYECKRTKNLLKVKVFSTADVLVLELEEGTGALKNKLGAVVVRFLGPDGEFYKCRVGSGFKLSEREEFWKEPDSIKGKIIEIGYFELSKNQNDAKFSLRFPTFKHLRSDKTEISMF
jgi:DNA ligase-1